MELSNCETHEMDFSFGRSCKFGEVRCCKKYMEEQISYQIEEEDADFAPAFAAPTTITTTTLSTLPTTWFVETTTTTSTTTTMTTSAPPPTTTTTTYSNLKNHRLADSDAAVEPIQYSSSTFHRYSIPSVLTKRPPIFFERLNSIVDQVKYFHCNSND